MAVANGGYPFNQRDVVAEIYNDGSNRSLTELFSAATGTFDPAYAGSKNSLYNFRNYQHIIPNGGYGRLYNHYALNSSKNIAPIGWHVPSAAELLTLVNYAGGVNVAGGYLREVGSTHWVDNVSATDSYGFAAVGGGYRLYNGGFSYIKELAIIGTTANNELEIYNNLVRTSHLTAYVDDRSGVSVRLIKDDSTNPGIMTDNSGYTYKTAKIGNQVWMASNLRGTKYRNGDNIPVVTDNVAWAALTTGACCSYANNDAWSNADNYVIPGINVRIELGNGFDGVNYFIYAHTYRIDNGQPIAVNTYVSFTAVYTYHNNASNTNIGNGVNSVIQVGQFQSANLIIPGPLVSYFIGQFSPTSYDTYNYSI